MKCRCLSHAAFALLIVLLVTVSMVTVASANEGDKAFDDHDVADFAFQGEYVGKIQGKSGEKTLAVQVIALGGRKFRAVGFSGGLPGAGADGKVREEVEAAAVNGVVVFKGKYAQGKLVAGGDMTLLTKDGSKEFGTLKKVLRVSPTLGKKAPEGATVLFDGSSVENWTNVRGDGPAEMTKDGLLKRGANSKKKFNDHTLHVEFCLPYMPTSRGQARGNSGCYLQGRYEVQMLDSFGLSGEDNECGGIYKVARPNVNMCFPPLSWQTYDIDFTGAKFDSDGKKTKNARATVRHNGVVIHDDIELPQGTYGGPGKEGAGPGVVHLQNHGDPVRYRNIWVIEK